MEIPRFMEQAEWVEQNTGGIQLPPAEPPDQRSFGPGCGRPTALTPGPHQHCGDVGVPLCPICLWNLRNGHDAYCEATSSEASPGYGPCQCERRGITPE